MATSAQFEKEHLQVERGHSNAGTKKRVGELEEWVRRQGWVGDSDLIQYAMRYFNVSEQTAKHYLQLVIEDFRRSGIPVIQA